MMYFGHWQLLDVATSAGHVIGRTECRLGDDIMRQGLLNLLPPVTVTALLLFWGNAPAALIDNRATLVIVIVTVVLFVQLLELRFARHG